IRRPRRYEPRRINVAPGQYRRRANLRKVARSGSTGTASAQTGAAGDAPTVVAVSDAIENAKIAFPDISKARSAPAEAIGRPNAHSGMRGIAMRTFFLLVPLALV